MSETFSQDDDENGAPGIAELIAGAFTESGSPAAFVEIHYLASEPGMLDVMRWAARLPEPARRALAAFARRASETAAGVEIETADAELTLRLAK